MSIKKQQQSPLMAWIEEQSSLVTLIEKKGPSDCLDM